MRFLAFRLGGTKGFRVLGVRGLGFRVLGVKGFYLLVLSRESGNILSREYIGILVPDSPLRTNKFKV